jgi:hypothetical protein
MARLSLEERRARRALRGRRSAPNSVRAAALAGKPLPKERKPKRLIFKRVVCSDCRRQSTVSTGEWATAARPRCSYCGGPLNLPRYAWLTPVSTASTTQAATTVHSVLSPHAQTSGECDAKANLQQTAAARASTVRPALC